MACTLEFVDDVQSAIDHINRYGRYAVFLHTISSSLFFFGSMQFFSLLYPHHFFIFFGTKLDCVKYMFISVHTQIALSLLMERQQRLFYSKLIGV